MERKAFLTTLKPGCREAYIDAHDNFPAALHARYKRAGVRSISIFLVDDQLFMYVEAEDFGKVQRALADDPMDMEWQGLVGPMKSSEGLALSEIFHME